MKKTTLTITALALCSLVGNAKEEVTRTLASDFGVNVLNKNITESEVIEAQKAWGNALIKISTDYDKKGLRAATESAKKALDEAYAYNLGTVLFKPTLTHGNQTFRTTREGALAYFVGSNKKFPEDSGFALKGWRDYAFENAAVMIKGDKAITMGKVTLVDKNGIRTVVDKTWGFQKDEKGKLRIFLHHSSLPFQPVKTDISQNN